MTYFLNPPHPDDNKKEVDMIAVPSETRPKLVFEFKFIDIQEI